MEAIVFPLSNEYGSLLNAAKCRQLGWTFPEWGKGT